MGAQENVLVRNSWALTYEVRSSDFHFWDPLEAFAAYFDQNVNASTSKLLFITQIYFDE
jgi:hypothetical protein